MLLVLNKTWYVDRGPVKLRNDRSLLFFKIYFLVVL